MNIDKKKFRRGMIIAISAALVIACILFFVFDPRDVVPCIGNSWSIGNFALMDIVVFECLLLIMGGYVTTTRKERRQAEEESIKVKWLPRLLSIPVMIAAVALLVIVQDVNYLPLTYFDQWTWAFGLLAIVQTVLVVLSRKEYGEVEEEPKANAA